jgi:hypothetical protein
MCGVETVTINVGGGVGDKESTIAVGGSLVAVTRVNVDAMVGASGGDPALEGAPGVQAHRIKVHKSTARINLMMLG